MTLRGHEFHQQTVYKIETGKRKITIGEALALAAILEVPLSLLTDSNPSSVENLRARVEIEGRKLLEKLVRLEDTIRGARDDIERVRKLVDELDDLDADQQSWPGRSTVGEFFAALFEFKDLDGLQWSWNQLAYAPAGRTLLRHFELLPPSELPIPDYDDNDEPIDG